MRPNYGSKIIDWLETHRLIQIVGLQSAQLLKVFHEFRVKEATIGFLVVVFHNWKNEWVAIEGRGEVLKWAEWTWGWTVEVGRRDKSDVHTVYTVYITIETFRFGFWRRRWINGHVSTMKDGHQLRLLNEESEWRFVSKKKEKRNIERGPLNSSVVGFEGRYEGDRLTDSDISGNYRQTHDTPSHGKKNCFPWNIY